MYATGRIYRRNRSLPLRHSPAYVTPSKQDDLHTAKAENVGYENALLTRSRRLDNDNRDG